MRDELLLSMLAGNKRRLSILLGHFHPIETATVPDMTSRRAGVTFGGIDAGDNFILGSVTYIFVSVLNTPAANTVEILIQSSLRETVKLLAEATRGADDVNNIAYGEGETSPNPLCAAYWTSQRFSCGTVIINAGENLFILERAEDKTNLLGLSTTANAVVTQWSRTHFARYTLTGNAAQAVNSVRGPMHTILPTGSVQLGGQLEAGGVASYDIHKITMTDQSNTEAKEIDLYMSKDEEDFIRISRSNPMGYSNSFSSLHVQTETRGTRIPEGYGFYIRVGSNGTSGASTIDLKFIYHLYSKQYNMGDRPSDY